VTLRSTVIVGALVLLAHAVAQAIGAASFWQPCFDDGYGSDVCMDLQYNTEMPWWASMHPLWPIEIAFCVAALVLASRASRRIGPALAALIIVVTCNQITDYALTPALNGGYMSADAAPGYGLFGAGAVGVAGFLLLLTLVPSTQQRPWRQLSRAAAGCRPLGSGGDWDSAALSAGAIGRTNTGFGEHELDLARGDGVAG
jgi:hypothetical protein